jgi:hypothetical protein
MAQVFDADVTGFDLKEQFEGQADWRRRKAEEFPDDKRNIEATQIFDHLAAMAPKVPADVVAAYRELWDEQDLAGAEEHNEMMRSVGFHYWPETAEQFCRDFIAARS